VSGPTRVTTAGRAYLDLRRRDRAEGRGTDELLVLYVLERFLYRVSVSDHRHRLVLKGGMLLAALDQRRPTRDVDLLALGLANDIDTIIEMVTPILQIDVDDGVEFDTAELTADTIRDQAAYTAVRLAVPATLATAQVALKVDVNVGDPVTPAPREISYPTLLDEPFTLVGYPIETVLAEKLVTMVERAATTTRDRDFADVWTFTARHAIDAEPLAAAIAATAEHREVEPEPLAGLLAPLAALRQSAWTTYLVRAGLDDQVPGDLSSVIDDVAAFADPLIAGHIHHARWDPTTRQWRR